MFEQSPSGGWQAVHQVMNRIQPTDQGEAVLRRLHESGEQSIFSLRGTVNTGEESLYRTISRLEDCGFVAAKSAREIEITDAGHEALRLIHERGASHE